MTAPNASTAMAEVVIDELVRGGVTHVVIAPGSRSAALAIAAARRPDVTTTVHIDERSAGFFALGIARSTGRPAAVLTTSGSAVGHLLPAVIEADTAWVPLVALTADRPPELHGVGANQTIRQVGIFGDRVRWSATVGPAEHREDAVRAWRSEISRAVSEARTGPVHVNLPFREPVVPESDDGRDADRPFVFDLAGRDDGAPWSAAPTHRTGGTPIGREWTAPERGVVVAGESPIAGPASVDRLAATLGWPLIAEPTLGARPAQSISTAHHLLSDDVIAERLRPDVAIVIGRANLSRPLGRWLEEVPTLTVDPRWSDPARRKSVLVADWPVVESVGERSGTWRRMWLAAEAAGREALDAALDAGPLTEPRVARDVASAVPSGGTLVVASSMPVRDLDMTLPPGSVRIVGNRGASGIDGFVSTALGVAAGSGDAVVALAGDLALLHDSNGLLGRPRPDVVFVVINNDGGGIFSFLPQVRQTDVFERVFGTPHGRSFEALASFHGLRHARAEDIPAQVSAAVAEGGCWIIEVMTDRAENPAVHRRLTDAVAAAGRAALDR